MRYLISCCFIYFLLFKTVIGQSPVVLDLEQQVYRFNNEFKYDSSQQLIQRFLSLQTTTNEDKYFAYLYLSYTYKRLYDYTSTLSHLDQALSYGILSPRKEEFSANIKCQKALALFDIHSYDQADSLMRQLAKTNYEYLNEEYQSKIIMQEAYLLFLKKSYIAAEKRYDLAITKMTQASICDLPMIYAKKIELYEAMNKDSAMNKAYQQAIQSADSCGIFKYLMYTNEIMAETYKHRRDYENAFFYLKKAENLRTEYNQKEHLTTIADLDKKYQTSLKDYQLKHQTKQLYYLIGILFLLFLAFLSVLGGYSISKNSETLSSIKIG